MLRDVASDCFTKKRRPPASGAVSPIGRRRYTRFEPDSLTRTPRSLEGEIRGSALVRELAGGRPEDDRVPEDQRRGDPLGRCEAVAHRHRDPVLWSESDIPGARPGREPVRGRPAADRRPTRGSRLPPDAKLPAIRDRP